LNSGFGLWLLSAVFLYGAGAGYALWHSHNDAARTRRAEIERLDLEISFRFSSILEQLSNRAELQHELDQHQQFIDDLHDSDEGSIPSQFRDTMAVRHVLVYPDATRDRLDEALKSSLPPVILAALPSPQHPSLYPDFEHYTVSSLMIALHDREIRSQQVEIEKVIRNLAAIKNEQAESAARQIKSFILPRWRRSFRQYFDCPDDDALCLRRDNPLWSLHLSVHSNYVKAPRRSVH
jgi:hypothetical protein